LASKIQMHVLSKGLFC